MAVIGGTEIIASFRMGGGGAGVSSINSVTGAITLAAGTGVSITPSGNTFTFANTELPGGTPTQLQYNNSGVFGGIPGTAVGVTDLGSFVLQTVFGNSPTADYPVGFLNSDFPNLETVFSLGTDSPGAFIIDSFDNTGHSDVSLQWQVDGVAGTDPNDPRLAVVLTPSVDAKAEYFFTKNAFYPAGLFNLGASGSGWLNVFTNTVTLTGTSGGSAALGFTATTTPNQINFPIATAAVSGQFLISDGGSPQQTRWSDVIPFVAAPSTATSAGTAGQIAFGGGFFYVCVATNSWERVAIAAW